MHGIDVRIFIRKRTARVGDDPDRDIPNRREREDEPDVGDALRDARFHERGPGRCGDARAALGHRLLTHGAVDGASGADESIVNVRGQLLPARGIDAEEFRRRRARGGHRKISADKAVLCVVPELARMFGIDARPLPVRVADRARAVLIREAEVAGFTRGLGRRKARGKVG